MGIYMSEAPMVIGHRSDGSNTLIWKGRCIFVTGLEWYFTPTTNFRVISLVCIGRQGARQETRKSAVFCIIPEWLPLRFAPARTVSSPLVPADSRRIHAWDDQCISQFTYAIYCDLWTFEIYVLSRWIEVTDVTRPHFYTRFKFQMFQ